MGLNMAVNIGVFLRKNRYYLRVMLPNEHPLHAHYKSGKVVVSLKGNSFREAQLEANLKRAEILSNQFVIPEAKRQGFDVQFSVQTDATGRSFLGMLRLVKEYA